MKKTSLRTVTVLILVLLAVAAASQDIPTIAVLDFRTNNISASDMRSISSLLSSALFKTGRFRVIDVTQRDTLLKELEFSVSGCTDESCQLQIGKMLSAEQIVVGDIAKVGTRYMLSSKMLRTETAGTLASADGIYATMDALVDDLYAIASTLAGTDGRTTAVASSQGSAAQAAQTPAQPSAGPLRIAILAPLSGAVPAYGVSARDGALLAISEWNSRGGVLGRNLEPLLEDGQCASGPALEAARRIIQEERVRFIVGEVCSQASLPVSKAANDAGVLMISPSSTSIEVTLNPDGKVKPFVFRACFIDTVQGEAAASFAYGTLNARKVFILVDENSQYSVGLGDSFERAFKKRGGEIVKREGYSRPKTDFSYTLYTIQRAKPDLVYLPDFADTANAIAEQAKKRIMKIPFLGGDGWTSAELASGALDGSYYTDHFFPDDPRPKAAMFREAFGKAFKETTGRPRVPDSIAALAYDAANMLLQAVQTSGSDDPAVVRVALEKLRFDGVTGQISFDQNHNPIKPAAVIAIRGGKRELAGNFSP